MNPRHEIEIKLEVRRPSALKRRLSVLGFRPIRERHFESNCLFDFPDRRLYRVGRLVRIRYADGDGILTFKGPQIRSGLYKVREEIETRVEDVGMLVGILEGIGLKEVFRYEKYRTVYGRQGRWGNPEGAKLLYDETPIGNYVELEGPERWIEEMARQLGYQRDEYIIASYGRLYREKSRQLGKEPTNMLFPVRKPDRKS